MLAINTHEHIPSNSIDDLNKTFCFQTKPPPPPPPPPQDLKWPVSMALENSFSQWGDSHFWWLCENPVMNTEYMACYRHELSSHPTTKNCQRGYLSLWEYEMATMINCPTLKSHMKWICSHCVIEQCHHITNYDRNIIHSTNQLLVGFPGVKSSFH